MSAATFFWLMTLSTGLAATFATWTLLNLCADWLYTKRTSRRLWVTNVAASLTSTNREHLRYLPIVISIILAFKTTLDGRAIFAASIIVTGLFLMEPFCTWLNTRPNRDITPLIDLTRICVQQSTREMNILQRLEAASSTLGHVQTRAEVEKMLRHFHEGATEEEAIQTMLAQDLDKQWALLISILLVQTRGSDDTKFRIAVHQVMRQRLVFYSRARIAIKSARHSLGLGLILLIALTLGLVFLPSPYPVMNSLPGQVISSLALLFLLWTTCVWSAHVQTLQRMME